jgi:DNA repair photolyase
MKRIDNPPNPYVSTHHEWLEPPPPVRVEVFADRSRTILSENDSPDVGFRWSVNPYRGCQHACAYCYARPGHEYLGFGAGSDFDSKLVVKPDAPRLLDAAFRAPKWTGELVAMSGVTDCYQPLEAVWKLTRQCLEVCLAFRNPVGIVTKSFLVVRDIDVLSELHRQAAAGVLFSIPFADCDTARLVEPGAPPPERRFEAMRRLAEAGVPVGILVAPIIPGLNDRDIAALLARAADCGATTASYIALRLPGSVEPVFLSRLREAMPLACGRVEHHIRDVRGGKLSDARFGHRMRGEGPYWESVRQLFELSVRRHGLDRPFRAGGGSRFRVPDAPHAQLDLPFASD